MAKPIPVNRRYLENHQGAPPPPPSTNYRDALRELIVILRRNPPPDEPDWDYNLWDDEDELQDEPERDNEAVAPPQGPLAGWDDAEQALDSHDETEILDPEALVESCAEQGEDAPVITARYAGTCPACGDPIHVNDRITRHAHLDAWVHLGCRSSQVCARFRSIAARYDGYCRLCRQPFPQGQAITNLQGYGWVHLECARRHQAHD